MDEVKKVLGGLSIGKRANLAAFLTGLKDKIKPLTTPEPPPVKLSQTQLKRRIRAEKTRPRPSCGSFRYRQKHQAELRTVRRWWQNLRRQQKARPAVMP